ncbi:DUF551 domain-containing protein [Bacteroides uniformis]|uniref:DUF551 domain-containing protein n=1 Tax=Bacteroides uniformis TaxID=820 RepID=UPI00202F98FC|nr:DUF551 domain-containing protein [Bacteroides uniformis]MCM1730918.1 DUF551 domain-containing protein [Bacteroides uniformis]MCM1929480.1 DUF551 domain-containing protein [Bacteroides uniformis]MCM1932980.1 DUF551 domain-containing protein [Bacteroides uniformis]
MKQTLEEAAHSFAESRSSGSAFPAYYQGFIAGAEWQKDISSAKWQAKQSPWISVEERLPKDTTGISCLVRIYGYGKTRYDVAVFTDNYEFIDRYGDVIYYITHYMPIPSFDEILEANKDVLQRIKEKGD